MPSNASSATSVFFAAILYSYLRWSSIFQPCSFHRLLQDSGGRRHWCWLWRYQPGKLCEKSLAKLWVLYRSLKRGLVLNSNALATAHGLLCCFRLLYTEDWESSKSIYNSVLWSAKLLVPFMGHVEFTGIKKCWLLQLCRFASPPQVL